MKLVRESLNEIRQDRESALSSIGVGAVSFYKAYTMAVQIDSTIGDLKPLNSTNWPYEKEMKKIPSKIAKALDTSTKNIVCIETNKVPVKVLDYVIVLMGLSGNHKDELNQITFNINYPNVKLPVTLLSNNLYGVSYLSYTDENGKWMSYICFRRP